VTEPEIILSIPSDKPFHGVARLVVGGLAARLHLSYEALEDLQLALDSVLERDGYLAGPHVTMRLSVKPESVGMVIGPLAPQLRSDLESEDGDRISLRRLLSTLVETVELEAREGGDWLALDKRLLSTQTAGR
jgi:hypothetical protein